MKMIVAVAFALVAVVAAAPVDQLKENPQIVRSDFTQDPNGSYNYAYETENKIEAHEEGQVKQVVDKDNVPQEVVVVRGEYSYIDPEGNTVSITYTADEFGFHPEGATIPKNK